MPEVSDARLFKHEPRTPELWIWLVAFATTFQYLTTYFWVFILFYFFAFTRLIVTTTNNDNQTYSVKH